MYCKNCGAVLNDSAEFCIKCGLRPLNGNAYCQACGAETTPKQELCVKCGRRLGVLAGGFVNISSGVSRGCSTATAGLVLGIIGLLFWLVPVLGFPITITGLVLSLNASKRLGCRGVVIGSIICSILGLGLTSINSIIGAISGANGLLF